jgi:hypothetical protein
MLNTNRKLYLILIFGIVLLVNPYVPGVHLGDGSVHKYEAKTVTYNESAGLQVTDPETGRELSLRDVDDDILCDSFDDRYLCEFGYTVIDGFGERVGHPDQFVYLNQTLYRSDTDRNFRGEPPLRLVRVDESRTPDPLQHVAKHGDLSGGAEKAISTGSVLTYRELPEEDTLIRHDSTYYKLSKTGISRWDGFGGTGEFCSSNSADFCDAAGSKRLIDSLLTLGSWAIGFALVVFAFQSRDPD